MYSDSRNALVGRLKFSTIVLSGCSRLLASGDQTSSDSASFPGELPVEAGDFVVYYAQNCDEHVVSIALCISQYTPQLKVVVGVICSEKYLDG